MNLALLIISTLVAFISGDDLVANTTSDDDFRCNYGGKKFRLGEQIDTPDASCFICNCHREFEEPTPSPPSSCAIIDCPWGYYSSKPHCSTQYTQGKCCPELRCSAPPPNLDMAFLSRKRLDESTDGYEIKAKLDSELTIYCKADNSSDDLSEKEIVWKHISANGSESTVSNTSRTAFAFFPPSTWAIYFSELKASDEGLYTCTVPTNPPQTQTTRIVVRTEPRPPVIDPICYKPAFTDSPNNPCPDVKDDNLPWYYNTTRRDCTQHTENSCKWAKENHFPTMSACWNYCLDDCYASSESGPCDALIQRYYYDHARDQCESFNYGGCGGNRNNFQSKKECEDKCADITYRKAEDSNKSIKVKRSTSCNVLTQCPWNLWLHYIHNKCQPIYQHDSCCPIYFDCKVNQTDQQVEDSNITCHYENQIYSSGQLIHVHNQCLSCICSENFNQESKSIESYCEPFHCDAQEMDIKTKNGCIPIYDNNKCCPIDWQCPPSLNTKFRQGGEATRPTTDPNTQCIYGGQNYPLGFDLISGYRKGINCICSTPPMFTCTVPSCPDIPSLSNEMLRCKVKFSYPETSFCTQYECWNILKETHHIDFPISEKEKNACDANPCELYNECVVNYTQCYLGTCQTKCEICAVPTCTAESKYVSVVNECPTCVGPRTPEEACEWNPDYCSGASRCVVADENECRQGTCYPACFINLFEMEDGILPEDE